MPSLAPPPGADTSVFGLISSSVHAVNVVASVKANRINRINFLIRFVFRLVI